MSCLYKENDVVIMAGFRTPVGKYKKAFASLKAHDLGAVVIKKIIEFCDLNPLDVSEVIIGQVYTAGTVISVIYKPEHILLTGLFAI